MSAMAGPGILWNSIQTWLFPMLEDELSELDEKHRKFVAVCETCAPQDPMAAYRWMGNGCPPKDRLVLCKAFIAKAAWDFPATGDLIDAVRHRPPAAPAAVRRADSGVDVMHGSPALHVK